jgi:hypothetical protein
MPFSSRKAAAPQRSASMTSQTPPHHRNHRTDRNERLRLRKTGSFDHTMLSRHGRTFNARRTSRRDALPYAVHTPPQNSPRQSFKSLLKHSLKKLNQSTKSSSLHINVPEVAIKPRLSPQATPPLMMQDFSLSDTTFSPSDLKISYSQSNPTSSRGSLILNRTNSSSGRSSGRSSLIAHNPLLSPTRQTNSPFSDRDETVVFDLDMQ